MCIQRRPGQRVSGDPTTELAPDAACPCSSGAAGEVRDLAIRQAEPQRSTFQALFEGPQHVLLLHLSGRVCHVVSSHVHVVTAARWVTAARIVSVIVVES